MDTAPIADEARRDFTVNGGDSRSRRGGYFGRSTIGKLYAGTINRGDSTLEGSGLIPTKPRRSLPNRKSYHENPRYHLQPHVAGVRCPLVFVHRRWRPISKRSCLARPARIFANIVTQDVNTGYVQINGVAMDLAAQPLWDFGDGTVVGSWFPAEHTYASTGSNYIVKVTGYFTDGATNSTEVLVRFAPPAITPVALPDELLVTIPTDEVSLVSRVPGLGFSPSLTHFDDSFFTTNLPREAVEYLLTVAATVQWDLVNSNVFLVDGGFQQSVLRDTNFGGMYSIWYSSPVAFGSGDYGFQGTPQYSSFFHEMGHNFTLNFPAAYIYGDKIGGNANAIYSETLAQIFQHATAYEIMNRAAEFGLPADLVFDIHQSARSSISFVRTSYEHYLSSGTNFFSWNDPATPADETFDTFMTIAYKFFAHAENCRPRLRNSRPAPDAAAGSFQRGSVAAV